MGDYDWLADQHLRTWLILMLLALDVGLFIYQARLSQRQKDVDATVRVLLDEHAHTQQIVQSQQDVIDRGVRTLAEISGHVEVALGRNRLSAESRELLEQDRGEAPGVDPAGERIPSGTGAPPL